MDQPTALRTAISRRSSAPIPLARSHARTRSARIARDRGAEHEAGAAAVREMMDALEEVALDDARAGEALDDCAGDDPRLGWVRERDREVGRVARGEPEERARIVLVAEDDVGGPEVERRHERAHELHRMGARIGGRQPELVAREHAEEVSEVDPRDHLVLAGHEVATVVERAVRDRERGRAARRPDHGDVALQRGKEDVPPDPRRDLAHRGDVGDLRALARRDRRGAATDELLHDDVGMRARARARLRRGATRSGRARRRRARPRTQGLRRARSSAPSGGRARRARARGAIPSSARALPLLDERP